MTDKRDAVVEAAREFLAGGKWTSGHDVATLRAAFAALDSPLPSDEELRGLGLVEGTTLHRLRNVYAHALRLRADHWEDMGPERLRALADEMEARS